MTITTGETADQSYAPRNPARCGICDQSINRHGSACFPAHYYPGLTVMTVCEGSGYTPAEVDLILADRAEQNRPGRYVRPHP
jgi:hypothetical protein